LAQCEREAILRALNAAHGQRNRAAQMMGISRSRLYRRMEALGVDLKDHP
jgi:DNA-binding NtrC family response regulator